MTRWKKVVGPFLNIVYGNIKPRRYNTTFVESASEVNNYFTRTVIINNFKFSNITCWWKQTKKKLKLDSKRGAVSSLTYISTIYIYYHVFHMFSPKIQNNVYTNHTIFATKMFLRGLQILKPMNTVLDSNTVHTIHKVFWPKSSWWWVSRMQVQQNLFFLILEKLLVFPNLFLSPPMTMFDRWHWRASSSRLLFHSCHMANVMMSHNYVSFLNYHTTVHILYS